MSTVTAHIHVTLKREVLDPQGDAIRRALSSMKLGDVRDVRVGKLIEIQLAEEDPARAEAQLRAMCEELLANPVIEDYAIELRGSTSR